jgi:predicted chitinase
MRPFGFIFVAGVTFASAATAAPYVADREALFRNCAVMPDYVVPVAYGDAVRSGTWAFSSARQAGAAVVLDAWEEAGDASPDRLAYVLATARRESSGTFRPLREAPACKSEECIEREVGRSLQKRNARTNAERAQKGLPPLSVPRNYAAIQGNGHRYYGRGFNQLTHLASYEMADSKLGLGLVDNPDLVLDPQVSAKILVRGLLEGWFGSSRPLSHYINERKQDWKNARDTTNPGSPNAAITAGYARDFAACLSGRKPD